MRVENIQACNHEKYNADDDKANAARLKLENASLGAPEPLWIKNRAPTKIRLLRVTAHALTEGPGAYKVVIPRGSQNESAKYLCYDGNYHLTRFMPNLSA